jgi:hypothetical protein
MKTLIQKALKKIKNKNNLKFRMKIITSSRNIKRKLKKKVMQRQQDKIKTLIPKLTIILII